MKRATIGAAVLLLASCGGGDKAGNGRAAAPGNEAAPAANGQAATAGGGGAPAMAQLRPGQWESRVEVLRLSMPNMPKGMNSPLPAPTVVRSCLTPEQARRPNGGFLTGTETQSGCTYENFSMGGGRIQGTMTCNRDGTVVRATVNGSFTAESYDMEAQTQVSTNGMTIDTASRVSSRRIGECPAR